MTDENKSGITISEEQKASFEKFEKQEKRKELLSNLLTQGENAAIYKKVYEDPTSGLKEKLEKNPEIIDTPKWLEAEISGSVTNFLADKNKGNEKPVTPESAPPPQQGGTPPPAGNQQPETVDLRTVGRKGGITVEEFCKKSGMTKLEASEYLAVLG